jgi:hypothetical protein
MGSHASRDDGVSIGRSSRRPPNRGGATGAGIVFDDDRLAERLCHMLGNDPYYHVIKATCRCRNNPSNGLHRIFSQNRERDRGSSHAARDTRKRLPVTE